MTQLGQQELMAPPPTKRLAVFGGATAHWGIDPSSRGISLAWITAAGQRGVRTVPFPKLDAGARFSTIYALSNNLAHDVALGCLPELDRPAAPGLIHVEQPSGAFVEHELEYAVGCVIAGVYDGVRRAGVPPARVETITSSWWKKRACGNGGIRKPKKRSEPYGVLSWALLNGYTGRSWDEADAWAIAEAARRDVALDAR
jgi:hypothetical protein